MKRSRSTVSLVAALRIVEQHLLDLGARRVGLFADLADVHRHLAPAIEHKAGADDLALDDDARALLRAEIEARQEDLADEDRPVLRRVAGARRPASRKKSCGASTRMPAPSPVLPSASTAPRCQTAFSAAMRQRDDIAARLAVDGDDEADAARVALVRRRGRGRALRALRVLDVARRHVRRRRARPSQRLPRDAGGHMCRASFRSDLRVACTQACIASAASRPSRIAHTTSEAPRTMSPAAIHAGLVRRERQRIGFRACPSAMRVDIPGAQILGIEAERGDDEIAGDFVRAAGLFFRRLAPALVRRAQAACARLSPQATCRRARLSARRANRTRRPLLPRARLRAASPACWRGRGDRDR